MPYTILDSAHYTFVCCIGASFSNMWVLQHIYAPCELWWQFWKTRLCFVLFFGKIIYHHLLVAYHLPRSESCMPPRYKKTQFEWNSLPHKSSRSFLLPLYLTWILLLNVPFTCTFGSVGVYLLRHSFTQQGIPEWSNSVTEPHQIALCHPRKRKEQQS